MRQIHISGLTKSYRVRRKKAGFRLRREVRIVHALEDISFDVESGEMMGLIGPNGAGKSTTIKILSGILVPDSGSVEILGRVPWKERTRHVAEIGVIFGQRTQLWWDVPIIDSYHLLRDIYSVPNDAFSASLDELVDVLDISGLMNTPLRQLSLGQRMRCEIAGALIHRPKILFLDEPTIGLDSTSKLQLRKYIKRRNAIDGTTIILTTHDMDDIEAVCSRVIVIGKGRILYAGTLDGLRQRYAPERRMIVTFDGSPPAHIDGARVHEKTNTTVELYFTYRDISTPTLIAHINRQCTVVDLTIENPDIDEVVSRMYHTEAM
jgi:ABC-2 type transport system ATP-binding protein